MQGHQYLHVALRLQIGSGTIPVAVTVSFQERMMHPKAARASLRKGVEKRFPSVPSPFVGLRYAPASSEPGDRRKQWETAPNQRNPLLNRRTCSLLNRRCSLLFRPRQEKIQAACGPRVGWGASDASARVATAKIRVSVFKMVAFMKELARLIGTPAISSGKVRSAPRRGPTCAGRSLSALRNPRSAGSPCGRADRWVRRWRMWRGAR